MTRDAMEPSSMLETGPAADDGPAADAGPAGDETTDRLGSEGGGEDEGEREKAR